MDRLAVVSLVLVIGCGRIGFDASDGSAAHDEDLDGVPDAIDVCPYLPGSQLDTDQDGVGDDCDPEPLNPRQHVALFATMQPGEATFTLLGPGTWTQLPDALHYDGTSGGQLKYDMAMPNVQVSMGIDVQAVIGTGVQHALALEALVDQSQPHDFIVLDEFPTFANAAISNFDGSMYSDVQTQALPTGVHTGPVFLQATELINASVTMDAGWPGEMYHLVEVTALYQGATQLIFTVNSLVIDIRYICIIAW